MFHKLLHCLLPSLLGGIMLAGPAFAEPAETGAIEISVGRDDAKRSIVPGGGLEEGQSFRDCDRCPEMVAVPAGALTLGKALGARSPKPEHVTFAKPFAIGKFTVTVAEWNLCVADGGCGKYKMPEGMADDLPAYPGQLVRRSELCLLALRQGRQALPPAIGCRMGICRAGRYHNDLLVGKREHPRLRKLYRQTARPRKNPAGEILPPKPMGPLPNGRQRYPVGGGLQRRILRHLRHRENNARLQFEFGGACKLSSRA